jgi:hypothetical protein
LANFITGGNNKRVPVSVRLVSDLPDGPYDIEQDTFGVPGLAQSNDCDENNQNGNNMYEGRLFVDHESDLEDADETVGGGSSTPPVGGDSDPILSKLNSLVNILILFIESQKPKAPEKTCPPTGSTVTVQAWLLANGYASGFHAIGVYAPTGYWGPVTTTAYAAAMAACK